MITRSVYKDMTGENKEKVLIGGLTAYIHFLFKKNCGRKSKSQTTQRCF